MSSEILNRDQNHITVLGGVTDDAALDVTMLRVDPITKRLKVSATGGGTGDVVGPASAVDGHLAVFDGVTGKLIKDGGPVPTGTGTVTSVSVVTANGVSGSVATSTTTPAITLTLGAITPTSVNGNVFTTGSSTYTGTSGQTYTFPTTSATIARTDAANTFVGASTASAWILTSPTITTKISPTTDDNAPLGDTTHNFSDLFLATGAVINYQNSNVVITHTSGILTMGTGDFRITTAGTNTASVVTVGGTQTLTSKTLTSPTITAPAITGATTIGTGATITTPTITKPVLNVTNPTGQTYSPSAAGTATLDLSLANQHYITMPAGNITIALSNDTNNQVFLVSITQDATGSRTVTWFTTIRWAGGSPPTLTTTASKRDTFGFIRTGSGTYDGFVIGQNI